jgi:hypothetical protein
VEESLAAVQDVFAAAVPEREMLVCGGVRRRDVHVRGRSAAQEPADQAVSFRTSSTAASGAVSL